MPLGGYKGSGLAMMVEILCSVLSRRRHVQRGGRHPLPRQDGAREPDVPGDRRGALHAGGRVHGAGGATGAHHEVHARGARASTRCWWRATRNGAWRRSGASTGCRSPRATGTLLVKAAAKVKVPGHPGTIEGSAGFHFPQARTPQVAACARAGRRELSRPEGPDRAPAAAHGVRKRGLSQRRRVLESAHRHLHDAGQRLHAALRILRGAEGRAAAGGLRRAGARRRGGRR